MKATHSERMLIESLQTKSACFHVRSYHITYHIMLREHLVMQPASKWKEQGERSCKRCDWVHKQNLFAFIVKNVIIKLLKKKQPNKQTEKKNVFDAPGNDSSCKIFNLHTSKCYTHALHSLSFLIIYTLLILTFRKSPTSVIQLQALHQSWKKEVHQDCS